MKILAIDVGSSSIKAAVLKNTRVTGEIVRAAFPTHRDALRVEVDPAAILKALASAIAQIPAARSADLIALSVMSPSWVAMDKSGAPLTPIITHQDRRSVAVAQEIEARVGRKRHLSLAGNRPFPGGISSTTCAWYLQNQKALMKRADLTGHLNTFLHRQMTGARVTDPSNASFMGFYKTTTLGGWSNELREAVGLPQSALPEVKFANEIGGLITSSAAHRFSLTAGTPMTVGLIDTSAALMLSGAKPGQLMNVTGSTDVLILCTGNPTPNERLLTRAIGVGRRWTSVSTIAAAGSSLDWARSQFYPDLTPAQFHQLVARLARQSSPPPNAVHFEPYLAGERTSIIQKQAAFTGLTLATTREHLLAAIMESLATASAARLPLLQEHGGVRISRDVILSGGAQGGLARILYRDWPGKWSFRSEKEATLRGLAKL